MLEVLRNVCVRGTKNTAQHSKLTGLNAKAKLHYRSLSYALYRCRLSFTLLRLLPSKGGCATTLCTDLPSATFSIWHFCNERWYGSPDHSSSDHGSPDHSSLWYASPDHSSLWYASPDHSSLWYASPDHSSLWYGSPDRSSCGV